MQLDQNPFFRKTITPWYDSNLACRLLIAAMCIVFSFALGGLIVASGTPEFSPHTWFPGMLCFLSGFLVAKIWLRLRARARHD
ncbi:MAG: hypothetical protein MI802_19405 [Desulfobacterales bacterium]|nr:hypothetical protein [Desulfobacterales bacterium]